MEHSLHIASLEEAKKELMRFTKGDHSYEYVICNL